jgi:hypothetical protein
MPHTNHPATGLFLTISAMHGWGSNAMDLLGLVPFVAGGRFLGLSASKNHL